MSSLLGVLLMVLAQVADCVTFLMAYDEHGLAMEMNPLVVSIVQSFGIPAVILAKMSAVVVMAAVFAIVRPVHPRISWGVLLFGITLGLVGAWSNG